MYQRRPDIIAGKTYGRLTAVKKEDPGIRGQARWLFKCECGNSRIVDAIDVKKEKTKSCGCLQAEAAARTFTIHGMCGTRLYTTYDDMKQRCCNRSHKNFANYGGRGITVCDEWIKNPQSFFDWAISNGYSDGLTIERIDNCGNYSPDNCRWATMPEQARNKRSNILITINGVTKILGDWAKELNANQWTVAARIRNGWNPVDALNEPCHAWNHKRKKAMA